ncbi:MAG: hypothetical protein BGO09_00195 [Bacteroidetes bacterium 47-18]|nr:MAG: hypothetical protein BGO09_00195 [Bacteroidetes bacterium 47-18]
MKTILFALIVILTNCNLYGKFTTSKHSRLAIHQINTLGKQLLFIVSDNELNVYKIESNDKSTVDTILLYTKKKLKYESDLNYLLPPLLNLDSFYENQVLDGVVWYIVYDNNQTQKKNLYSSLLCSRS